MGKRLVALEQRSIPAGGARATHSEIWNFDEVSGFNHIPNLDVVSLRNGIHANSHEIRTCQDQISQFQHISSFIASLQHEMEINKREIRTCQEDVAELHHTLNDVSKKKDDLEIRNLGEYCTTNFRTIQDVLWQQEAVVERNFTRVVEEINRLTRDFTSAQGVSGPESDPAPSKLVLSNFTSSDLPGVKALQDLANQLERRGSSSVHTSQNR